MERVFLQRSTKMTSSFHFLFCLKPEVNRQPGGQNFEIVASQFWAYETHFLAPNFLYDDIVSLINNSYLIYLSDKPETRRV